VPRPQRLDFVGREVQEPAVVALKVGGRVVVREDREMHVAVDVMDHGRPPGQEQVLGVGTTAAGAHPDLAAAGDPEPADHDMVGLR
jgi:hypothetical protein